MSLICYNADPADSCWYKYQVPIADARRCVEIYLKTLGVAHKGPECLLCSDGPGIESHGMGAARVLT